MGMQINTDFSQIEPSEGGGGSYLPISDSKGWLVIITESGPQETKDKEGMMCVMNLVGQEGPVQGKSHTYRVNVTNKSQKAVEIGMSELSAVAHVTGHTRVGNSQEWHGKPFRVVTVAEPDANGNDVGRTRIVRVNDVHGNSAKKAGQGAMGGGAASGFGGGQQQQNNGGFGGGQQQQNGGGFQGNQQQQNSAGFQGGNGGQDQQGSGQGGTGFGNGGGQPQGQGQQFQGQGQGQGQDNGGQFQPNGNTGGFQQGNFQPNGGGQAQNNGGGFGGGGAGDGAPSWQRQG